jgi:hypothetical protein
MLGIGTDSTLTTPSTQKAASEVQLRAYVRDNAPTIAGISTLRDSVQVNGDSITNYNTRLQNIENGEVGYDIEVVTDPANSANDTIITYYNGGFAWIIKKHINESDSIDNHTDQLQTLDGRIDALEAGGSGGSIDLTGISNNTFLWDDADAAAGTGYVDADSIAFTQTATFADSVYLPIFGGETDVFLTLASSGAVDTGITSNAASAMLTMKLPSLKEHLGDLRNGEIKWYEADRRNNISYQYGLVGKGPISRSHIYMGAIELGYRWILEEQERREAANKVLENRILIMEELVTRLIKER